MLSSIAIREVLPSASRKSERRACIMPTIVSRVTGEDVVMLRMNGFWDSGGEVVRIGLTVSMYQASGCGE